MSFKKIKETFDKIKEEGSDYFNLEKEKETIELKIKELKSRYKEGDIDKDIFSNYNKKLLELSKRMEKIGSNIVSLSQEIDKNLQEELQDAIA